MPLGLHWRTRRHHDNLGTKKHARNEREKTTYVLAMARSNISFIPLCDGLVTSEKTAAIVGKLLVDGEALVLLCIGNASRGRMKVQLVGAARRR